MKLGEIAHARTGDKGNISNISLIVFNKDDFHIIHDKVTAKAVRDWFADIVNGTVDRYELPQLGALNFVLHDALGGGVTQSLAIDKHGKCLSSYLLEMEL